LLPVLVDEFDCFLSKQEIVQRLEASQGHCPRDFVERAFFLLHCGMQGGSGIKVIEKQKRKQKNEKSKDESDQVTSWV
jgi:hypothetical protein